MIFALNYKMQVFMMAKVNLSPLKNRFFSKISKNRVKRLDFTLKLIFLFLLSKISCKQYSCYPFKLLYIATIKLLVPTMQLVLTFVLRGVLTTNNIRGEGVFEHPSRFSLGVVNSCTKKYCFLVVFNLLPL